FDLSNPEQPKQTYERVTGKQVNMISQSWDGTRVYIASSLLANWDKAGADDEQFVRAFRWDGQALTPAFEVDFYKERLGRALELRADDDHDARAADDEALQRAEHRLDEARSAVGEVGELLRQARMHVVEVRQAQQPREHHAEPAPFLVRVDRVVLAP